MINWTIFLSVLGASGIFSTVLVKVISLRITELKRQVDGNTKRIEKVESDTGEMSSSLARIETDMKHINEDLR